MIMNTHHHNYRKEKNRNFFGFRCQSVMFRQLKEDIQCIKDRDPAAASIPEILLLYPGLRAIRSYRKANWCHRHNLH